MSGSNVIILFYADCSGGTLGSASGGMRVGVVEAKFF